MEECVICLTETEIDLCVPAKRHPPALSREANTDVTKSVIHRLAAGGGLQTGVDHNVYSLVQKVILAYIANFALRDNCEGVHFLITHPFKLY